MCARTHGNKLNLIRNNIIHRRPETIQKCYNTANPTFSSPMILLKKGELRSTSSTNMLTKEDINTSMNLLKNDLTPKKLIKGYKADINKGVRSETFFITKAYTTKNILNHKLNETLMKSLNKNGRNEYKGFRSYIYNFFKMKKSANSFYKGYKNSFY